jgi:hypothetical protein
MGEWKETVKTFWSSTFDLLDVVIFAACSLITVGVSLLWGAGWACLALGSLLLSLVLLGLPGSRIGKREG